MVCGEEWVNILLAIWCEVCGMESWFMYCVSCVYLPRLKAVKTVEELSDVFAQFSLYYGRDLVDMQHLKAMQKRQGDNEDQVPFTLYQIPVSVLNTDFSTSRAFATNVQLLAEITLCTYIGLYKWKNHFSEMKGDIGTMP